MKPEVASRRIESFGKRFGEAHLYLAYHAAFPLALTPDLLYRLWANFQRDIHGELLNIPWLAVADLLLSGLCDEAGYELYEMDTTVRDLLLRELKANSRFDEKRINELSDFLLTYVRDQIESHDPDIRDFAQAQRWTALAYTRPSEAARELALVLSQLQMEDKAEWVRMASLLETFAEPLAEFEPLLIYAREIAKFVNRNTESSTANITGLVSLQTPQLNIAGVPLPIPQQMTRDVEEVSNINQTSTNIIALQSSSDNRILIVDSSPDNLFLIKTILEEEGYIVSTAENGFSALAQLQASPIDLVLLAIELPGIDGYEVTRRIRQELILSYVPILLITALGAANVSQGLDLGADDFIRKPVTVDELLARVRSLLRLKNMLRERQQRDHLNNLKDLNVGTKNSSLESSIFPSISNSIFINTYNEQSKDIQEKIRLYNLAEELNADPEDIIKICNLLGIKVKSYSSIISRSNVQRIRAAFRNYFKSFVESLSGEPIIETKNIKNELNYKKDSEYTQLHNLLSTKRWQEADQKTEQLIFQISGAERQGWLGVEELKNLSCQDLQAIDQLWVEYSNGRFGFSVQQKIWESLELTDNTSDYKNWWDFGNTVGWRVNDRWLTYKRIKFTSQAPTGHLPFFRAWIGIRKTGLVHSMHQVNRFQSFMSRCKFCIR